MKDVTDVYRQAIAELEAAQRLKDRLFQIASHDLKSPLGNVAMVETLLRQMYGDDPAAGEILDALKITVRNMKRVIEEFLEMAACQSGGIDVHLEPIPAQAAITEVVSQYTMTAHEKAITLEMGAVPGVVRADRARLQQVLSNLLSNALKYSSPDTTVTLWSEAHQGRVRIHIADQGPGIPADEQGRLFKEFSKLSNKPTGDESSTGLGLWIVKHMMELQNGTVGVECPSDGGSIFWIELAAE
jgi:signal transduction histidine kinase